MPIRQTLPDGVHALPDTQDLALQVREGPLLFSVGAGRQDDVGQLRRLGHEWILADQELQLLERGLHLK